MTYTVKKLAELSGVSVRTLHHYDEIGLLKPAYIGENNYRYYEQGQLLMLQQILFYRELGISLNDIQSMINSDDFDKLKALESHRHTLEQELDRHKKLIKTIDKTIAHLQGKEIMTDKELYYGFDSNKQKAHEKYLVDTGIVTQEFLDECNAKVNNWSDKQKNDFIQQMEAIMQGLIMEINLGSAPESSNVQKLMDKHYHWLQLTWDADKEGYLGLAELYQTPEFRKFFDERDSRLLVFIVAAMKVYAARAL